MSPIARSFVLALVAASLLASTAQARPSQSSMMMDDDPLLYRGAATAQRTMTQMKWLGADTIRVTVLWSVVADKARFTRAQIRKLKSQQARAAARLQTKRFRGSRPKTYPLLNWDRYDDLVRIARAVGLRVYFNVTGPGPKWAHSKPPRSQRKLSGTYKPKPSLYRQLVKAVGRRFSGSYRDENQSRSVLPRVSFWSLWNEPNQAGWLAPQWDKVRGRRVLVSAMLYRKLYQHGYKGLTSSGHRLGTDKILLGETAPLGSRRKTTKSPSYPAVFLRELSCLRSNGSTKYSGAAAEARGCNRFGPKLRASGYAHHPYTKNVPTTRRPPRNGLTMANISKLGALLDKLSSKSGRKIPSRLPLWMTEFGYETNPPDPFNGVTLAQQALYSQLGEYLAFANRRIASQTQFLLRDVLPVAKRKPGTKPYWFTYQSGLYFSNGVPKPAAYAYALPFLAFGGKTDPATGRRSFRFWGQLRFLPDGANAKAVIQGRPKGSAGGWTPIGSPIAVSPRGYFQATHVNPIAGAVEWRGAWLRPDGRIGAVSLPSTGTSR